VKNNMTRLVNEHLPHLFNAKTLHTLDFVASGRLLGIDVADTPTNPAPGDAYHTAIATTGDWDVLRMNDQIVVWNGGSWTAIVPYVGFTARVAGLGTRVYVGSEDPLVSPWIEVVGGATSAFRTFEFTVSPYELTAGPGTAPRRSATGDIIDPADPNYASYSVAWDAGWQHYPLLPPNVGGPVRNMWVKLSAEGSAAASFSNFQLQLSSPSGASGVGGDRLPAAYDPYISYPYLPISTFSVVDSSTGVPTNSYFTAETEISIPFIQQAREGLWYSWYQASPTVLAGAGQRGNGWLVMKVRDIQEGFIGVLNYDYPCKVTVILEQDY
jgi:hypothetical protein